MHNNNPCASHTSCTAPGVLQGLWETTANFSSFLKYPKWQLPKVRQLSARISRQRKEIARWTRGDSESSDDLQSMIIAQNFDLKLPSGCKIGLKMSSFCKKCVKKNLTLWRHSDVIIWPKMFSRCLTCKDSFYLSYEWLNNPVSLFVPEI